jgi:LPS-assembly protein
MKNKILIILVFFFSLTSMGVYSKNLEFKALEIQTFEEGNIIIGVGEAEAIIKDEIEIYADKFDYNKEKGLLIATGNVTAIDKINNTTLKSQVVHYLDLEKKIISYGITNINVDEKYQIKTKDLYYFYNEDLVFSENPTNVRDKFKNNITLMKFKYSLKEEILKGSEIELFDYEKNRYLLNNGIIKLKENLMLGKDITVYLRNDTFGYKNNEPRILGNAIIYKGNNTLIKKGIFTSCKNEDNCPPWSITSKEITHDKSKKQINYKNSWLKIYDIPVMYFPKFFHPDPSVKRQSGFLKPNFGNSTNLGASINMPYFHVISDSTDLTFRPRIFNEKEFLLQSELRNVTNISNTMIDFSFNKTENDEKDGHKTHFFADSVVDLDFDYFDKSSLNLKLEKVSNDTYLKLYSIESTSPIVKDTSTLESVLGFSGNRDDFSLDLSFESYETMGKISSDRYEFIYPNYSIYKNIDFDQNILSDLDVTTTGYQKKYSTNIYEIVQVNDLLMSSQKFISEKGIENNFQTLFKNVNSKGTNSSKFKEKTQSEILSIFKYDFSYPLRKNEEKFIKFLTPKISIRHSPNDTKNIKNEDRRLNKENIFSLNRIGSAESIEGGSSITIGSTYEKTDLDERNIIKFFAASVIRNEVNENLPTNSTLGEKQSDIVGGIFYSPVDDVNFDYNYSIDDNFSDINLHSFATTFSINNFVNTFEFYEENGNLGSNSYITNSSTYNMDDRNSLTFSTRENKKNDLTEYYNLIYQYKNDCLTASIKYNKEYYSNNDIKPSETLFLTLTLIPLGATQTDSLLPND